MKIDQNGGALGGAPWHQRSNALYTVTANQYELEVEVELDLTFTEASLLDLVKLVRCLALGAFLSW